MEGKLERGYSSKEGSGRTLRITAISPDSKPQARWASSSAAGEVDLTVDGTHIKFVSNARSRRLVELKQEGDDLLVGTLTVPSGRSYPIKMTKIKPSTAFDGEWVGDINSRAGCWASDYQIIVKDSLVTGKLQIMSLITQKSLGQPSTTLNSPITGEVNADGTAAITLIWPTMEYPPFRFSGKFTSTEFRGTWEGAKKKCTYEVYLRRR